VVETVVERENDKTNREKYKKKTDFFFISHPFFLLLNAQNPFLFIGGGRGTSYIY
jgi:hypothetical protein